MMQKLFAILWRISAFLLPWQTRWILIDGHLGKFPWEQGTVSVYASWIPTLATIVLGVLLARGGVASRDLRVTSEDPQTTKSSDSIWRRPGIFLRIALILLIIVSAFTASVTATLIWWAYAAIIGAFVWVLVAQGVPQHAIAAWVVISVVPHAVLGIEQFLVQGVFGSSYLGIAPHVASEAGTSVVEHGLYRVLRAYGGLPHPNILGGWIAVSFACLPELIRRARSKFAVYGWLTAGLVLTTALVYTFSRGAWAASGLAFFIAAVLALLESRDFADRQGVAILVTVCAIAGGFGLATQWDHVIGRITNATTERLEAWSLFSRTESFVQGWHALGRRPFTGWGPGSELVAITDIRKGTVWAGAAPEPPHAAPAVFVLDTGILGFVILGILITTLIVHMRSRSSSGEVTPKRLPVGSLSLPILVALVAIAFTDHYLVTLWSGMALLGLSVAILAGKQDSLDVNSVSEESVPRPATSNA